MRFRLVTVAILLAVASGGHGRPRDPDPLDSGSSSSQEALAADAHRGGAIDSGSGMSRYMMTMRRTAASTSSPTFNRRRDISITSVKYGSGSSRNKSSWQGRSIIPGLSFETGRKNYLPLGGLSSVTTERNNYNAYNNNNNKYNSNKFSINNDWLPLNRRSHQSVSRSFNNHSPFVIPFITSSYKPTPIPIPVSVKQNNNNNKNNVIKNTTTIRDNRKLLPSSRLTPKPIPVSISRKIEIVTAIPVDRGERKLTSRNLVRITPQKLKPGFNFRRNSTAFENKPDIASIHLKNWPNEVVQNVQDLLNYERYTSFLDDDMEDRNKVTTERPVFPINNREPTTKKPETHQGPLRWSKVPTVETLSSPDNNDLVDIDTSMQIDSLLDDLGKTKDNLPFQASSEISQNTVVHIMNAGSRKPNVTVVEQKPVSNKVNKTKTASTRPPQNVHITFMMDKDTNQTTSEDMPPVEVMGTDSDCPTIMINSITQINNTIESKEGCTDLNIVINSHVLNTHVFKPDPKKPLGTNNAGVSKNPYVSDIPTPLPNNYNPNTPTSNYQNNYNQNDYGGTKDPVDQVQSDDPGTSIPESESQVQTFEVFQGTHINIGGNNQPADDTLNDINEEDSSISGSDESTGTDADGSPLEDPSEGVNDISGANPGGSVAGDAPATAASVASNPVGQAGQFSGPADAVGTAQANDAPGAISLPSLPNIPNIANPGQLANLAGNLGGSNSGGTGGTQTALSTVPGGGGGDDDDDDDIFEALSPVNLLDSISSVFTYITPLNPINYGILGMAVAPFVAFAAGVVGVAAFLFPWAFPGSLEVARSWDVNNRADKIRFNHNLRDIVHSSIHKYRHINEWKGRRRKKKRKR